MQNDLTSNVLIKRYISSPNITTQANTYIKQQFQRYISFRNIFKADSEISIRWLNYLFRNGILPSKPIGEGAYGSIYIANETVNHESFVIKIQSYDSTPCANIIDKIPASKSSPFRINNKMRSNKHQLDQSNQYINLSYHMCEPFMHELQANILGSFLYRSGYNSNLLNFYGAFALGPNYNPRPTTIGRFGQMGISKVPYVSSSFVSTFNPVYGVLVLEQVIGNFANLESFLEMKLYIELVRRHQLPDCTIHLAFLLQILLSLDQLQATGRFLHADLKPANIFVRLNQTLPDSLATKSSCIQLVREHFDDEFHNNEVDNHSMNPSQSNILGEFFIPNIGIEPVIADLGLSAFRLEDDIYTLPKEDMFPVYGLREIRYQRSLAYNDFGIDPYAAPLPFSSFIFPPEVISQTLNPYTFFPSNENPLRAPENQIDPNLQRAYNSYDVDYLILTLVSTWSEKYPVFKKMANYLNVSTTVDGRYVGKSNQLNWINHSCDGLHPGTDANLCPIKSNDRMGQLVFNQSRPIALSQVTIFNFIYNSSFFNIFKGANVPNAFLDPNWSKVVKRKVVLNRFEEFT